MVPLLALHALVLSTCGDATTATVPNRPPVPVDSIPSLQLAKGDTAHLDVAAYFADPDGDSLSYSVETSDPHTATATVAGSRVAVTAIKQGVASITVTATDAGSLSTAQSFEVNVPNLAPVAADSIPDLEIAGDSLSVDLSDYFNDPDGDVLQFAVEISDSGVVAVTVLETVARFAPVARGKADVVATATDEAGLSASQGFEVEVPNQAPVVTEAIPDLEITGDSLFVDVSSYFRDPDGDTLRYAAGTSHPDVVGATIRNGLVMLTAVAEGSAGITVAARDPGGRSVSQNVDVRVSNRPPVLTDSLPPLFLPLGAVATIDLSAHFRDPEGRTLRFGVENLDTGVVGHSLSGGELTLTAIAVGTATITVTARDDSGLTATQSFAVPVPSDPDRTALVAFYRATNGQNWTRNSNWLTEAPLDRWYGVDMHAGRVVGLRLSANRLRGRMPPELALLSELQTLSLWDNDLSGAIPREIGRLVQLQYLNLGYNHLDGHMPPELGRLVALVDLRLQENRLTGPTPSVLGNLKSLNRLELFHNELTGPIPLALTRLRELETLDLGGNRLTGSVPAELGRMTKLKFLVLRSNDLSGSIPPELGSFAELQRLDLGFNNLTGSIPPELGGSGNLADLSLRFNGLTGSIPPELANLQTLGVLWLDHNSLTGSIPAELGSLPKLWSLWLNDNGLSGSIPPDLGGPGNLAWLSLGNNSLEGSVPSTFIESGQLRSLGLAANAGLCVPGTDAFVTWLRGISVDEIAYCNKTDMDGLAALHEATGGTRWTNSDEWLGVAGLDRWYGVTTDTLGRVVGLDLEGNGLAGQLPSEMGDMMDRIGTLRLNDNDLFGPFPVSMIGRPLQVLTYADTDLCVPADESFQEWLTTIASHQGTGVECPPLSDREILKRLYEETDGPNWVHDTYWMTDQPLRHWYGVEADREDRVIGLDLANNGLSGPVPVEIGSLTALRYLWLQSNHLVGHIPAALGRIPPLEDLDLSRNKLTGRVPSTLGSLQALKSLKLDWNALTGTIPAELGSLSSLIELDLERNDLSGRIPVELGALADLQLLNLGHNRLTGPIPPELGDLPRLRWLDLEGMRQAGRIPAELGGLTKLRVLNLASAGLIGIIPPELGELVSLEVLYLFNNGLTGPIPPGFSNLANLSSLSLFQNDLSGPIPPDLGNIASLFRLQVGANNLTGPIPPELGKLANLGSLHLYANNLTGPIPPELGKLANLRSLHLYANNLTGPVPPEIGKLAKLTHLRLDANRLTGTVPAEVGGLAALWQLQLSYNAELSGPLPAGMTNLRTLAELRTTGTGLCAPPDPDFTDWLQGVEGHRLARCGFAAAYLTQATQSLEFPVPLVAGEEALLRVFVTAKRSTNVGIPRVRATFFLDGREVHVAEIPAHEDPIPPARDESSLSSSANARIPGSVVQPGLETVIEVDPNGELDPTLGIPKRIPETGRLALDVQVIPPLDLTLVPFLWTENPDSAILEMVEAMEADPGNHELLRDTRTLLPVSDIAVTAHQPVLTSSNDGRTLFRETDAIRILEGGRSHYMGMMSGTTTGPGGQAWAPGRTSFAKPDPRIMAHELGHNMSLLHAPCGARRHLDPEFPQSDGSAGAWGYDVRDGGRLVDPSTPDLMSYCDPHWISEYGFTTALRYRLRDEGTSPGANLASKVRSLLLWGGIDDTGQPFLEPVFVVDAPPVLPVVGGEYRLEGAAHDGRHLFSLDFEMREPADSDSTRAFAFALPVVEGWAGALASVTLSGPDGSATVNAETSRSAAILLDRRSRRVRGIVRNVPTAAAVRAATARHLSSLRNLEVLVSRGIPEVAEWRR